MLKFTNFATIFFLFAGSCLAAINIDPTGNAEISDFIKGEGEKAFNLADSVNFTVKFESAKDNHSRAGVLFFMGERELSLTAYYTLETPGKPSVKNSVKADTSWITGYCGMIECRSMPMPAEERIEAQKFLVSKIYAEIKSRIQGMFVEKKAPTSTQAVAPTVTDSASTANSDTTSTDSLP